MWYTFHWICLQRCVYHIINGNHLLLRMWLGSFSALDCLLARYGCTGQLFGSVCLFKSSVLVMHYVVTDGNASSLLSSSVLVMHYVIWPVGRLWKLHLPVFFSDRSPDVDNDSDEDEVHDYNEFSSNDEMSDSEPMMMDEHHRPRKTSRIKSRPATATTRVHNSCVSLPC